MGKNKALIDIKGKKCIDIHLDKLLQISDQIHIILGENFLEVKEYLKLNRDLPTNVHLVYNEAHQEGMFSSVKKGFEQTSGKELIMLQMIDQPLVKLRLYKELIEVVGPDDLIVQPAVETKGGIRPGHPILFTSEFKEIISTNAGSHDLREVIRLYHERRKLHFTVDGSIFMNINTPDDLRKLNLE